jgi:hypothetical protein
VQCIVEVGKKHLLEGVHVHTAESDRHKQSTNSWAHLQEFPCGFRAARSSNGVSAATADYLQNAGRHKRECISRYNEFMSQMHFVNVAVCYQDGECLHTKRILRCNTTDNGHK